MSARKPGPAKAKPRMPSDGLTFEEIAKRLDMPPATVKHHAYHALAKMRAIAEADGLSFEELFDSRRAS